MMELITYTVWFLAIMQIADILTWILRRIESLIKKKYNTQENECEFEEKKDSKTQNIQKIDKWKIVRWSIIIIALIVILYIWNESILYSWWFDTTKGKTNGEWVFFCLGYFAIPEFLRTFGRLPLILQEANGTPITPEQKSKDQVETFLGSVFAMFLWTLLLSGGVFLAFLFIIVVLIVGIFAKPIILHLK